MKDPPGSHQDLLEEISSLKLRIKELERAEDLRTQAEEILEESERKFRDLSEKSVAGVYLIQGGVLKYVNSRFADTFGYSTDEMTDKITVEDVIFPEDWPLVEENLKRRLSGDLESLHYEFRIRTKKGDIRNIEVYSSRTWYQGKPAVIGTLLDITDRKEAERQIIESKQLFDAILSASPVGIGKVQDRVIVWVNETLCRYSGYAKEELQGKDVSLFYVNDEECERAGRLLYREGQGEARMVKKDGTFLDVFIQISPTDSYSYVFAIADITGRKRMEEALRQRDRQLRDTAEKIPGIIFQFYAQPDGKTGLHYVSESSRRIFDLSSDTEDFFERFSQRVAPECLDSFTASITEAISSVRPWNYEGRFIKDSGESMWFLGLSSPVTGEREILFNGVLLDITERKKAEYALKDSEERFRAIVDQSPFSIMILSPSGEVLHVNDAHCRLWGISRELLMEENYSPLRDPQIEKLGLLPMIYRAFSGERITVPPMEYDLSERFHEGHTRIVEADFVPILNASGELASVILINQDVTERERGQHERNKLQEQLRQSQKMEAIGTLAGGIAHDFNNILSVIAGYSSLVQMQIEESNPLRKYVDEILSSSERATNLTRSLLAFSRKQPVSLAPTNINNCVKGAEKILRRLIPEDVEISISLAPEDIIIMADATQVDQILINLAANARDAMKAGGRLTIETRRLKRAEGPQTIPGFNDPGQYALLTVSDTGCGIEVSTREKIFDPFFTTKEPGKGTGLGLSTVYGIVKQHDGHIDVSSEPGKGTTFSVYFPAIESQAEEKMTTLPEIVGGHETVLIAEDNEAVRFLLKDYLRSYGYTVIEAVDGQDAIEMALKHDNIDLVILDSVMPKKNGREAHDTIRNIKPHIKALFMSGYTKDVVLDKGVEDGEVDFIAKPILPSVFLKKIREVMDK